MIKQLISLCILTLTVGTLTAIASEAPNSPATAAPVVDQRQERQQQRIDQGVATGQVTPREARRLEREQGRIERHETRAKADGTVTPRERKALSREQNRASRDIYNQKHDRQRVRP
jgi:hypothetical protein